MALIPSIPTSFVPHDMSARKRPGADLLGTFSLLAYVVLGIVFAIAIALFFYGRILSAQQSAKEAELAKTEAAIDPETVNSFVRLRDRLNAGQTLLDGHVAYSNFFSSLEKILPASVRFTTLHVSFDGTVATKVEGTGTARSFNALSAASAAFSSDGRIKDVIFSKISVAKDNSVSFGFSAALDPRLTAYTPSAYAAAFPTTVSSTTTLPIP